MVTGGSFGALKHINWVFFCLGLMCRPVFDYLDDITAKISEVKVFQEDEQGPTGTV